jgi:hypothetical protein
MKKKQLHTKIGTIKIRLYPLRQLKTQINST